ncbi:LIM domain-containing protein C4F6.12 [Pseudocercospora fuligena]|uniref:LIM domain-containing protein C4F6.12 n=1 Tax=Pseudocercospora fuligena TaxID=685502 RepID=A0A8H6VBX8_9PEZI|nr:LIM domain-containing protein C4F6.12 [Pseudocercospora fuligena]
MRITPTAQYLKDLRSEKPRPSGSRPPPPSKFGSLRRSETVDVTTEEPRNGDRPTLASSSSMPHMHLAHRRTESNTSTRTMNRSPFAGRPLARAPSASPEPPSQTEDKQTMRRTPSIPYIENGTTWMQKQESKSLRQALQDMDLREEQKMHAAARDEAAELVWKHQNPEAADGPYRNPDLKDYRSHLRKGSYSRTFSQGSGSGSQRSASDGSQSSNPASGDGSASIEPRKYVIPRKVSPPSNEVSVPKKRRESNGKSYDQIASSVAQDIAVAHRRVSSGSKRAPIRIMSGEKKKFMHPDDRIWEDPEEGQSPAKSKAPTIIQEERRESVPAAPSQHVPSYIRKNPFARVRAHVDRMERSNSAPTLQTLPGARSPRHDRVEIHRNPPSQSRNALYTSNEPLSLPPTPPRDTGHDAEDEIAPKRTPTKNGIEIRGDDIRSATSKSRRDYSPALPRPTVVSDKPGRPIVSFKEDWKLKEIMMEEQQSIAPLPRSDPTAEPFRVGRAVEDETNSLHRADSLPAPLKIGRPGSSSSRTPPESPSKDPRPQVSPHESPSKPASPRPLPESPSRIPKINVDEVPKWKASPRSSAPSSSSSNAPPPPIPTICAPDDPPVPSISLPEEPAAASPTVPVINVDVPEVSINGASSSSPPRSRIPQRPLPSAGSAPAPGRPLPRHANTTPVLAMKSTPHMTPSIRQSGALCAHCALPIAGRILSAAGERFHPGCFVCHHCETNLECVAFYPEPDKQRSARVERIHARQHGLPIPIPEDATPEDLERWEAEDGDESLRFYCHLDFHEMFSPRCKSCKTPIEGEVIVACGAEWHAGHFFCAQCGDPFDSTTPFVEKDGYAWCVGCHTNRYSSKCRKCKKPVTDVVVKALGSDWHANCFVCLECNGEFEDGRYFLRGESQDPVCVKCEERRLKA